MNHEDITERLRVIVEKAGVIIRAEHHPSSLTVEFTTSPHLDWTWNDCDQATLAIVDAPFTRPDKFGCHPEGEIPGTIGDLFSTDHDRAHSHWRFRVESTELATANAA